MESVVGRYKNLIVLGTVLFVQILGLAVQVRRTTDSESSRLIRIWAVGAVAPFEKVLVWVQTSTGNVWHNYFYLRGVRAENRDLKQQIERMRLEQVRMTQDADQARRLQSLLAFKEQFVSQTMAAQVIGSSGSEQSRSVYIDKGEKDGIQPDMAVITANGIVGKILRTFGSTSLVLLINDQTSGVGAILEKSRLQGILRGTATGGVALEKVMSDETVAAGEPVVTSGGDRIFPKGLPIGTVMSASPGSDLFLNIRVKPATDLNRLEEVLVVTKIDERQAMPETAGPIRAADILAERLPGVPQKPAEGAVTGSAGTGAAGAATLPATTKPDQKAQGVGSNAASPKSTVPPTPAGSIKAPPTPAASAPANGASIVGRPSAPKAATVGATSAAAGTATKPASAAPKVTQKIAPAADHGKPSGENPGASKPPTVKPAVAKPPVDVKPQPTAQDAPH